MNIKFKNAGGLKDGIYEVKVTKIKRVKVGKDKKPATAITFIGKGIERTENFFDNYFGGQRFEKLVRAIGFTDFDVTEDEIDSDQISGESLRVEIGKQKDSDYKEIKNFLPLGEVEEEDDDDVEDDYDDDYEDDDDEYEEEEEDDDE